MASYGVQGALEAFVTSSLIHADAPNTNGSKPPAR
jgi:hypothetical protein